MAVINTRNLDPTGDLPLPDSEGRIILTEKSGVAFGLAAAIFFFGCLGLARAGVLIEFKKRVVGLPQQSIDIMWFTLCLSVLASIFLITLLLFPVRLTIDQDGIALRKLAITSRLLWDDILEIKLVTMAANTNYWTVAMQTFTEIKGRSATLSWDCAFTTNPKILADYLRNRAEEHSGKKIATTLDPSSAIVGLATNIASFKQSFAKVLLGLLIAFGIIFCLLIAAFKIFHPEIQL
jgi:hypothetical protein